MRRLFAFFLFAFVPVAAAAQRAGETPPDARYRQMTDPDGRVTVHYTPGDSARAARTLSFLAGQPPLPALPPSVPDSVRVYLAPDEAAFDSLTGGRIPEWGAGVAVPGLRTIVMPAFSERGSSGWSEARTLRHEWAHLGLHQWLQGLRIPRWFDEGYAEWASGGWDAEQGWQLRVALARGALPDMDSVSLAWPRDRSQAQLAYMLAGTAFEYLIRTSGERGVELLLERWREERSFSTALRRVYGVTPGQFEEDWQEYVKDRYGWLFVLSRSAVFWLFLALALLVLFWIRRRRQRREMARLRATEPPESPAFWTWSGGEDEEPGPVQRGPTLPSSEAKDETAR